MSRSLLSMPGIKDRSYSLILAVCGAYSIAVSLVPFARLVPRFPLQLLIFGALYALYLWKPLPDAAKRWVYYLVLTGSYQALRIVVSTRFDPFHGPGVTELEQRIFGVLPTVWLQSVLHPTPGFRWYDYAFAVLHASLFAFPLLLPGVLLWRRGPDSMKRGAAAVTLISMAGYLTYVLFPLTPPWMAKLEGAFPEVQRIVFDAMGRFTSNWLQGAFQPSPRGAMPSLHAGLPFMTLLVALHEFGRRAAWVALPVAAICFEVVYGAEHYVIDILAGLIYGFAAYVLVYRVLLPDGAMRQGGEGDEE